MPSRLSDLLTFRANREPLPVSFGFNFLSYRRKSLGIFVALISFSSLANADCSEALVKQLIDNKFSPTQIIELCGKVTSPPPVVGTNTGAATVAAEVKPAADAPAAVAPATVPKAKETDKAPAVPVPGKISAALPKTNLTGKTIHLKQSLDQDKPLIDKNNKNFSAKKKSELRVVKDDGTDLTVVVDDAGKEGTLPDKEYVQLGGHYKMSNEELGYIKYTGTGIDYGMLLVPFKYQFKDHSISGSATVGVYAGFTWNYLDSVSLTPLVSFGISPLTVQSQTNAATTSTVLGFTTAVGVAFSLNKLDSSLQGGLICGQDRAGSNAPTPYKYEGKWWCSAEIGFPFAQ